MVTFPMQRNLQWLFESFLFTRKLKNNLYKGVLAKAEENLDGYRKRLIALEKYLDDLLVKEGNDEGCNSEEYKTILSRYRVLITETDHMYQDDCQITLRPTFLTLRDSEDTLSWTQFKYNQQLAIEYSKLLARLYNLYYWEYEVSEGKKETLIGIPSFNPKDGLYPFLADLKENDKLNVFLPNNDYRSTVNYLSVSYIHYIILPCLNRLVNSLDVLSQQETYRNLNKIKEEVINFRNEIIAKRDSLPSDKYEPMITSLVSLTEEVKQVIYSININLCYKEYKQRKHPFFDAIEILDALVVNVDTLTDLFE